MNTRYSSFESDLFFKNLTAQDFMNFGVQHWAYIKPVWENGRTHYAIHAADGRMLVVLDSAGAALAAVLHNNLEPVALH